MKKKNIKFLTVALAAFALCLGLQSCEQTLELTKMKLTVTVDNSAKVEKEDARQAIVTDELGSRMVVDRLDRSQISDAEIGNLVLSTSEKLGFDLKQLKTKPILKSHVTGSYVWMNKGDSLFMVAGFVGDKSTDAYLMTVKGEKDFDYTVRTFVEDVDYKK